MNVDLLLRLDAARSSSLSDLRTRDAALAAALEQTVDAHVERAVSDRLEHAAAPLVQAVREHVVPPRGRPRRPLAELRAQPALAAQLGARHADVRAIEQVATRTEPSLPLAQNAALRELLGKARVASLATSAGLAAAAAQVLSDRFAAADAIDHEALSSLVQQRHLTAEQAQQVSRAVTLANVVDHDGLARVLIAERIAPRDLARLDAGAWQQRIARARIAAPADLTVEEWAEALVERMAAIFPTTSLVSALTRSTQAEVARTAALVARVHDRNPEIDLLELDYSKEAKRPAIDFDGMAAADQAIAIGTVKSYQRVLAIAGSTPIATRMLEAGYDSAARVVMDGRAAFASKLGAAMAITDAVYAKAQHTVAEVSATFGTILDAISGGFSDLAVGNLSSSIKDYLKDIDGFEALFGSQASCRCEHCQSILGPAAYFVDLMCFVEKHVTSQYFTGARADHPLALRVRRPDLWKLELTCANTNDRIPTLDVINEILENYIALARGFAGSLSDRAAIDDVVYRQAIATQVDSFRQPFHLALARLDTYLTHFGEDRLSIARVLDAPPAVATRARLKLSPLEYALIAQPNTDPTFLRRVYALPLAVSANGEITAFDAHRMLRPMGVTREDLGDLVATSYVRAVSATPIAIRAEKTNAESVQNDIERIRHLTFASLDRMHRFTRLQRALGWTVRELDLVLGQLAIGELDASSLDRLVRFVALRDSFGLPIDETCALVGAIPLASPTTKPPLFDRLFNLPFFVQAEGAFPQDGTRFVHPSLRAVPQPSTSGVLARLLAGLRVSDEDLLRLIRALETPLGCDLDAADENARGFALTVANLSLLYRHARLASLWKLDVTDLFRLLAHAGMTHVASEAELAAAVAHHAWWKSSRYSLDDIAVATGGLPRDPSTLPDADALALKIVGDVKADRALLFADTLFAFFPGITEEQSRAIVVANPNAIEAAPGNAGMWIPATYVPGTPLVIPAGIPITPALASEHLLRHHAGRVLPIRLAAELGLAVPRLEQMLAMLGIDLAGATYTRVLQEAEPATALAAVIRGLVPLRALFSRTVWDVPALELVRVRPDIFGISSFQAISISMLRRLSTYAAAADTSSSFSTQTLDPADVRAALAAYTPNDGFSTAAAELARVLRADPGLVATIVPRVTLPASGPEALEKLTAAVALAQRLGISGETLSGAIADDYAEIMQASGAVLAAFRARHPDEKDWLEQVEPFDDRIRQRKRDGLVDHLLFSLQPDLFENENDLYYYFLIDVELCGCARTSRVVAATSSVQLYVHRVLMNLEQDRRPPGDPQHVAIPATAIPAGEWIWRKNYRVWEANRKVFLWPENYIEPELRDDKSPQFVELEDALQQQDIDDQTVLDAYAKYLAGFDEIAKLKLAGAYHDIRVDSGEDVLHLFGVVPGDPPVYYYRTGRNVKQGPREAAAVPSWSPWRKVDAAIPATRVGVTIYKSRLYLFWTEWRARSMNKIIGGSSRFGGYRHTMKLRMTTLRLDGTWSPPQDILLPGSDDGWPFGPSAGEILDEFWPDADTKVPRLEFPDRVHEEPRDDYTLGGPNWEGVYLADDDEEFPGQLNIVARNYSLYAVIDLFRRRVSLEHTPRDLPGEDLDGAPILCSRSEKRPDENGVNRDARILYYGHPVYWYPNRTSYTDLVLDDRRIDRFNDDYYTEPLRDGLYQMRLLDGRGGLDLSLLSIAGATSDAIIQHEADVLYLQRSVHKAIRYKLSRIGTTLSERINEKLFADGVDGVLATSYQLSLAEQPAPVTSLSWRVASAIRAKPLDYAGAAGVYYREIFFHIPFLIANALNAQGKYQSAQRWYHYIFDPTASETTTPKTDRNWRYAEFRGLDVTSLRDMLTDSAAIEVYKNDPFNPHAIARLRLSAYQKCIVMKYIDNLLDWGDQLFSQFTMESVGEATLLYVMAQDILGERPAELGECGEGAITPKTYEMLEPLCKHGSEFLLELETHTLGVRPMREVGEMAPSGMTSLLDKATIAAQLKAYAPMHVVTTQAMSQTTAPSTAPSTDGSTKRMFAKSKAVLGRAVASRVPMAVAAGEAGIFTGAEWNETKIGSWKSTPSSAKSGPTKVYEHAVALKDKSRLSSFGLSIITQVNPAFCVPANKDLRAYWDRVEDRLFKIRNCMDISGVRRELALFAPEIDPRMLVRMRAAGLSLDDVLGSLSGNLPPYRFQFLIERAKQAAAALQGYGAALLAALEKKDGEELGRLRTLHQQHLLQLTTKIRRWEIDACDAAIEALERQREAIEFRRDYFQALATGGLNPAESVQMSARLQATEQTISAAMMDLVSSVLHLIPQAGSPFALKYGGLELGNSAKSWADFARLMGGVYESISQSAGMIAGFQRRHEGWEYQRDIAEQDLKPLERQLEAAKIRKQIAERALELHDKTVEQTEEMFDFLKEKFTNQALYTFLSTQLQKLYRDAYQGAYAFARLAEQAFRFERPDDDAPALLPTYWDSNRAGFLAGEKLSIALNQLERHFIETNYRTLEIDQPFSITQLDPRALIQLRETGSCELNIPELFFDVFYPGQYNRRLKHAKLTIPCITGPYTNVSATLSLVSSQIRSKPVLGPDGLVDVPPRRSVSIATSTAQSDAGVFELSFRDERYMPFEGLGAVSRWRISLPKSFRPFDYQTINDVILTLSYTAREDGKFREDVEAQNAQIEGTILNVLSSQPLGRLFSLRQDFSSSFHRLVHGPIGTQVAVEITDKYFPLFLKGRALAVTQATLVVRTTAGAGVGAFAMQVGSQTHTGFAPSAPLGNLFARDLGPVFSAGIVGTHTFAIANPGALAAEPASPNAPVTLDPRKIEDVLLYIEYTVG